jgi:hypothetical protein
MVRWREPLEHKLILNDDAVKLDYSKYWEKISAKFLFSSPIILDMKEYKFTTCTTKVGKYNTF